MKRQAGISLIEVLVALLVMTIALLGAAALQLNALKYTDSAARRTQASFIAYDMLDRIRANTSALAQYALPNLGSAPASPNANDVRLQDLYDFRKNIEALNGTDASIVILNTVQVTVNITWDDTRAGGIYTANGSAPTGPSTQSLSVTTRIATDPVVP
jgi:type IV pilus assembly protein PilV